MSNLLKLFINNVMAPSLTCTVPGLTHFRPNLSYRHSGKTTIMNMDIYYTVE